MNVSTESLPISKYGVPNRNEQIIMQIWCHASFLFGVLGNMLVLYATIYHKAIKIDRMSLWIIQNLAAADVGNCVFVLLPNIVSLNVGWNWIFGEMFCKTVASYSYVFLEFNILFANALSLNKLSRVLFPLRNLVSSQRQRLAVTFIILAIGPGPMYWTVYNLIFEEQSLQILFNNRRGLCSFERLETIDHGRIIVMDKVFYSIYIFLPGVALVILNMSLILVAIKKTNSSVHKKNIFIVVLITGCLSVCTFPFFVSRIKARTNEEFQRFAWFILYSTSWINTPIYIFTNSNFRGFIKRLIKKGVPKNSVHVISMTSRTQTLMAELKKKSENTDHNKVITADNL